MNLLDILAVTTAALFAVLGVAKLLAVPAMRALAAHVGLSVDAYRGIGALELAGAIGLLVGVAVPALQVASGAGLLLLLVGAVAAHRRVGDGLKEAAPALVLAGVVAVVIALAIPAV